MVYHPCRCLQVFKPHVFHGSTLHPLHHDRLPEIYALCGPSIFNQHGRPRNFKQRGPVHHLSKGSARTDLSQDGLGHMIHGIGLRASGEATPPISLPSEIFALKLVLGESNPYRWKTIRTLSTRSTRPAFWRLSLSRTRSRKELCLSSCYTTAHLKKHSAISASDCRTHLSLSLEGGLLF